VATKTLAWSPLTDSILAFATTLEQLLLAIGHSTLSRTKGYGAHQIQGTTRTVLEEQTEGALSKALLVAGLMDPGHRLSLLVPIIWARFQVLVAEAATSIFTQSQAATLFLQTTWL